MAGRVTRESYMSGDMHLLYSLKSKKVIPPADTLVNQFVTKSLLTWAGCGMNLQLPLVTEGSCLISTTDISCDLDSSSSQTDFKEFRDRWFAALAFLFTLLFWTLFLVSLNFSLSLLPKRHVCIWEAFQLPVAEVGHSSHRHICNLLQMPKLLAQH